MKYVKFIINGYRGISDVTEIDISKESLIPIIGKNESGKTTCLEAILAFDNSNDSDYSGKHLSNVENLYSTGEPPITVSAVIEVNDQFSCADLFSEEIEAYKSEFQSEFPDNDFNLYELNFDNDGDENEYRFENWQILKCVQTLNVHFQQQRTLRIDRNLRTKEYSIDILKKVADAATNNQISKEFVRESPYILYFDDFRDRLDEKIFIVEEKTNENYSNWIKYIEEIFQRTKENYSIFKLSDKHENIRKSIVKEVQKELNKTLIEEWSNYQFDKNEDIAVQIEYVDNSGNPFLQLKIVEKVLIDGVEEERYFDISDRSKGFYWYVNFMIKLHYNPNKRDSSDNDTVYLLDEPGSYLHTFALNRLAQQLKNISLNNVVIYCTHSHNLLNPDYIPINSIRLAEKDKKGKIILKRLDHKGIVRPSKNSAYQSVFDALEVKPPLLEFELNNIVLLEGIYDYYSFKMFSDNNLNYFPCVSASSINNQIPYMIFLGKNYIALWDNDNEGRERLKKATEQFGEMEAKNFMTLDLINGKKNTRLEEYYNEKEIENYTGMTNLTKSAFCKFVLDLYYSENRNNLITEKFPLSKLNFETMEKKVLSKLERL